tara:strand:- start:10362 stop:10943 length:582 start_codon:yes stop_codon:yes gene_type:complete
MSTLKVGSITNLAGNGGPYQKGSVIQVKYYQLIDNATLNYGSQRNADISIPNFQIVITPGSTNSIIKLDAQFTFGHTGSNFDYLFGFLRNGTKLANSGSDLTATELVPPISYNVRRRGIMPAYGSYPGQNQNAMSVASYTYFDTPATTSPVTYNAFVTSYDVNSTIYINCAQNTTSIGSESGTSWMSATEIGG